MNPKPIIPQFNLQNDTGQFVDFHIMLWGKKDQNYDFEKPHRHNFNEVLFFIKGGGTHDIDFTTYTIQNHSVHFVASDNVHLVLRNNDSTGCSLLFSNDFFEKKFIEQLPFSKRNPTVRMNEIDFANVNGLVESIKAEYVNKGEEYLEIIHSYLNLFFLQLKRIYKKQNPHSQEQSTKPELINRFFEQIRLNYLKHLSVEHYAEHLNISAKHLIDVSKTHTGKTPHQHIKEFTISEAKKLLFHTPLSIKEIAYELGFEEPSNFSKYFKSATNYTPAEYREGIR